MILLTFIFLTILCLIGTLPIWDYSQRWGFMPSSLLMVVLFLEVYFYAKF